MVAGQQYKMFFLKNFIEKIYYNKYSKKSYSISNVDLIKEELNELEQAMKEKNLKEVADALTDILYVTYGAGCAYGIDLDKCFKEVQRANMSKLGEDGKPIYNDKGKVMKGPNYTEPNLKQFVE